MNYLDELGLVRFWEDKIKPLIFRKATLQTDLVVKNPRVPVGEEVNNHTFTAGMTMEEVFNYLYRNIIPEADPTTPIVRPTVSLKINVASNAELYDLVDYVVMKNTFNPGTVGTCIAPWEEEPHQSTLPSGSTEKANTLVIYSGPSANDCPNTPTMTGGTVEGQLAITEVGPNHAGIYFSATTKYTGSTANSVTSYNNPAHVVGVSTFGEGTTEKSPGITFTVTGYKPAFGNISESATQNSPTTILNLGNKFNTHGTKEFYYGPVNTVGQNNVTFQIYFPAEYNASVEYFDTITQAWTSVDTVTVYDKYANLPAKDNTSRYPDKGLATGVEYGLIQYAAGQAYGARRYRLTLRGEPT